MTRCVVGMVWSRTRGVREAVKSAASVTQGGEGGGRIKGEKRRTRLRRHLGLELDGVTDTGLVALRLGPPKCRL